MTFVLAACTNMNPANQIYRGSDLKIGVIGQAPNVREGNIHFEEVTFEMWNTVDYDRKFFKL